jgi:hypothetical protein
MEHPNTSQVLNTAIVSAPVTDSPYHILNHKAYRYCLKAIDCAGATPIAVFTVTGDVVMAVVGIVKTSLTTSDAIAASLGVSGSTAAFIANVADATGLAVNEIWHDASPDATIELESVWADRIVSNGQDVILTTTGTVTDGDITFYCRWYPLSATGAVTAA